LLNNTELGGTIAVPHESRKKSPRQKSVTRNPGGEGTEREMEVKAEPATKSTCWGRPPRRGKNHLRGYTRGSKGQKKKGEKNLPYKNVEGKICQERRDYVKKGSSKKKKKIGKEKRRGEYPLGVGPQKNGRMEETIKSVTPRGPRRRGSLNKKSSQRPLTQVTRFN